MGYAQTAKMGTRWTTAQGIINKFATALGMLIVAKAMSPAEYGMASVAVVASGFVMVFPVLVMADIIVTHQHRQATVARAARIVTIWTAVAVALAMMGTAPIIAQWYEQYSFLPLAVLLAICGLRPIAEAFMVAPLARLRIDFRYREIALINGTVQFGATVLTVLWAILWPSAAAIVVPQVIAALVRGLWFTISARSGRANLDPRAGRLERRHPDRARAVVRRITTEFSLASLAQYVHTVVSGLPLLVVSRFASEEEMGLFAFSFALAYQASGVLSSQLGLVLQPIFGRLRADPKRQIAGFMRVVSLISALMGPLGLLQAALAVPFFTLLFDAKWLPAIPVFVAFSVGQAFDFTNAPAMALLKAQGRFGTYFLWQVIQAVVILGLSIVAVLSWGPIGVAWIDIALWAVTMPLIVWLGCRSAGIGIGAVLRAFLMPWITAAPIAFAVWCAWYLMPGPPLVRSTVALVVFGPAGLLASILAIRLTQPAVAEELAPFMRRLLVRIPLVGRSMANWFAPVVPNNEAA